MAGRIRDADIAEVRDRNRIEELIGDYVALRHAGPGSVKGLCPFHDEKTPSFSVRPTHGTFHCFGCGEHGSVIDFLMKIEQLGFVEAVEKLADRVGYRLTYEGGGSSVQRDRGTRSRLLAANKLAAEFYAEQLRAPGEAQKAREFLAERGFDQAAAESFGCGFAPAGWEKLTKHLLAQGFTLDELEKAGLSVPGQRGHRDRFQRRLLWPIRDLGGDVVGFGARRLFDDDRIEAKYLNTPETSVYHKSKVLFGLDKAKREIAKGRQAVIVEGYTDVMAMHLAGVPTAVASCGTAFGDDHVAVLRRLLMDDSFDRGEVIYVFDGDEAGQAAALKAFDGDQQFSAQTYIATAPEGMDPCELRQARGDVAVRDLVAQRSPLFTFAIRSILDGYDLSTVEGQTAALQRTVPLVAQIRRVELRDGYARRLAGWTGWPDEMQVVRRVRETAGQPEDTRAQQPGRRRRVVAAPDPGQGPAMPAPNDPVLRVQREVLKAALQVPALAGPVYDTLPDDVFSHAAYLAVHRAILAAGGTSCGLSGSGWLSAVSEQAPTGHGRLVSELAVEPLQSREADDHRYVSSVLAGVQEALVGRQVSDIKSRLQRLSPVTDADEYHELFGDLVALEQYKKALREQAIGQWSA